MSHTLIGMLFKFIIEVEYSKACFVMFEIFMSQHMHQIVVIISDMPPGTDCPYPIRILAFFEMIRPYHVVIRI